MYLLLYCIFQALCIMHYISLCVLRWPSECFSHSFHSGVSTVKCESYFVTKVYWVTFHGGDEFMVAVVTGRAHTHTHTHTYHAIQLCVCIQGYLYLKGELTESHFSVFDIEYSAINQFAAKPLHSKVSLHTNLLPTIFSWPLLSCRKLLRHWWYALLTR